MITAIRFTNKHPAGTEMWNHFPSPYDGDWTWQDWTLQDWTLDSDRANNARLEIS